MTSFRKVRISPFAGKAGRVNQSNFTVRADRTNSPGSLGSALSQSAKCERWGENAGRAGKAERLAALHLGVSCDADARLLQMEHASRLAGAVLGADQIPVLRPASARLLGLDVAAR